MSGGRASTRTVVRGWHRQASEELKQVLASLGSCSPAVPAGPELMALVEPILRADFAALAQYRHQAEVPFDFPITVHTRHGDEVSKADALAWPLETTLPLQWHGFPGDHFSIVQWLALQWLVLAHA